LSNVNRRGASNQAVNLLSKKTPLPPISSESPLVEQRNNVDILYHHKQGTEKLTPDQREKTDLLRAVARHAMPIQSNVTAGYDPSKQTNANQVRQLPT
jgi:hypothetical protein